MELVELIKSIDIVEYISNYIELTQKGDEWWGLSCFKDEKTPSFSVRQNPPVFYDYSSGIGGNLYTFIKNFHKCSSKDAVEILKAYAGYEGIIENHNKKMSATTICKKYARQEQRHKASTAVELSSDYMERYEKDMDKLSIWVDEGISQESLDKFQVRYDRMSDRIVYPIRSVDGKIVNIGGRTIDPKWKEKGLRKYCYFYNWGILNTLYGLYENYKHIIEKKEIILFEGCKSVLIANTWGIKNCAAILTSHLNPYQMKILARLGCKVVFALDKDVDIAKDHNINKLKKYINVYSVVDIDDDLDYKDSPVDKGEEVFRKINGNRIRL